MLSQGDLAKIRFMRQLPSIHRFRCCTAMPGSGTTLPLVDAGVLPLVIGVTLDKRLYLVESAVYSPYRLVIAGLERKNDRMRLPMQPG